VVGTVGAVRVIDAATGAVLSTEITPDRVEVLEVTPDGATAFAGGGRGEAFALFLDVATGAVDRPTLPVGATSIGSAALRADGQRALADVVAPGVTFGTSFVERTGEVTPVGLTGHVVPLGQDRALVAGVLGGAVYDLATGETVASVPPVDAPLAAGAGDGQRAVIAERLETLVRFDGAAFQRSPLGEGVEGDAPRTVAFSPDGQRAVVTLGYSDNLAVVDVAAGQIVARLPARTAGPADAVFTPDGARIIVTGQSAPGSPDGAVVVLDAVTGAELDREMPVTSRLRAVLVTPDGTRAVVHDAASGAVLVYALTGAGLEFEYAAPIGGETGSTTAYATQPSVRLSPTGRHVVGLDRAERRVYVLDLTTGGSSALNVNALYSDFGFSADGSRVLVTSIGRRVFLIALGPSPTPELLASRTFPDEVGPVAFDAVAGRFLVADPASTPASFFEVSSATGTVLRQTVVNEGFLIEQIRWTPETGTVLAGRSPDGEVGYVSSNGDRTALLAPPAEVDVTGRTVVAAIPGPDRIEIVALAPVASEPGPTAGPALAVGPNPSAGPVAVRLTWPETGPARVEVLDVLGRTVAVLHDGPLASGPHTFSWAAGVVPGTYVVRAEGASTVSGRVTVVR
jgi:DNA-binding beta-propeller fold protein YncE